MCCSTINMYDLSLARVHADEETQVQVYLYIGLLSILFLAISANVAGQLASRRRRRRAARYAQTVRPSARCARTGKGYVAPFECRFTVG